MPYLAANHSELVDNVERVVLEQYKDLKPSMVRSLFTSVPWNEGDGDRVTFNSICLSGFAGRVSENQDYPEIDPTDGNELTKIQQQYGDKLSISRRMEKFVRYRRQATFGAKTLAERVTNTLDLEMTIQAFIEADNTTVTFKSQPASSSIATSDGQAVASATHSYGGVTFSNILSGGPRLSKASVTLALNQGTRNTPDDFGTYITPNFDTIVIDEDYDMKIKCHELFGSSLTPESDNNAVNYYGGTGKLKVISLKYGNRNVLGQTSTDNIYRWMVMDSKMCAQSWQLMMAETPTTEQKFVDSDNLIAKILVTQFAAFAIVQPQGTQYSLSVLAPELS